MNFLKTFVKQIFQFEARLILKKYNPKIIAITGSVGKTSTRDAIYLVLSKKYFVRKSEKSFTTELGVPLTIIGCSQGRGTIGQWIKNILLGVKVYFKSEHYPDWLILEVDGDRPGDFARLSTWFHPDMLVVTTIGDVPSHVEVFGNTDMLVEEKKYLLQSVKTSGIIFFNGDDTQSRDFANSSELPKISIGMQDTNVTGTSFAVLYGNGAVGQVPTGMQFEIKDKDESSQITIFNSIGVHNEYACLFGYAIGRHLGISARECAQALKNYRALPGRMNLVTGIKDTVLIDDSYNASPIAMHHALSLVSGLQNSNRKIAVIGDMLELGKYSAEEHKKLAQYLKQFSLVMCVGIRTRMTAEELRNSGFPESQVCTYDTAEEAGVMLQNSLEAGDIVLIKGSQAMRLERVIEEVMRHPQDKGTLLIRQELEWQVRD